MCKWLHFEYFSNTIFEPWLVMNALVMTLRNVPYLFLLALFQQFRATIHQLSTLLTALCSNISHSRIALPLLFFGYCIFSWTCRNIFPCFNYCMPERMTSWQHFLSVGDCSFPAYSARLVFGAQVLSQSSAHCSLIRYSAIEPASQLYHATGKFEMCMRAYLSWCEPESHYSIQ